jgi:hypothetical protein
MAGQVNTAGKLAKNKAMNGSGAWTNILDQSGNNITYTLNSGEKYTLSISNRASSSAVIFTLTFLYD